MEIFLNTLASSFFAKRGWLHGLVGLSLGYIFTGAQDWSTWDDNRTYEFQYFIIAHIE